MYARIYVYLLHSRNLIWIWNFNVLDLTSIRKPDNCSQEKRARCCSIRVIYLCTSSSKHLHDITDSFLFTYLNLYWFLNNKLIFSFPYTSKSSVELFLRTNFCKIYKFCSMFKSMSKIIVAFFHWMCKYIVHCITMIIFPLIFLHEKKF